MEEEEKKPDHVEGEESNPSEDKVEEQFNFWEKQKYAEPGQNYNPEPPRLVIKRPRMGGIFVSGIPNACTKPELDKMQVKLQVHCFAKSPQEKAKEQEYLGVIPGDCYIPGAKVARVNMDSKCETEAEVIPVFKDIMRCMVQGEDTLIHCAGGGQQAPLLAISFRMVFHQESFDQAKRAIERVRAVQIEDAIAHCQDRMRWNVQAWIEKQAGKMKGLWEAHPKGKKKMYSAVSKAKAFMLHCIAVPADGGQAFSREEIESKPFMCRFKHNDNKAAFVKGCVVSDTAGVEGVKEAEAWAMARTEPIVVCQACQGMMPPGMQQHIVSSEQLDCKDKAVRATAEATSTD